jgi:putative transposase
MFKVKYCHKVFEDERVRAAADALTREACAKYSIRYGTIWWDSDHVHMTFDIGLRSRPEVAKLIKGYVGRKLLKQFPEIKKRYFWNSELWNPSYYMDSSRGLSSITNYVNKQKYGVSSPLSDRNQTTSMAYAA